MGLGKTLQVISFVDVFLRYSGHKHVLVVVPVNTISVWHRDGGVLLLGYETFRILVQKRKTGQMTIDQTLLDPGPSLVICDEGHRIKNENAQIAKALKQIRTKRRI